MSSKAKIKGTRVENQIRDMHLAAGVECERVPGSGMFGSSMDKKYSGDLRIPSVEKPQFVCEVKARKDGAGFATLEKWLGDHDIMFLKRNNQPPMVVLTWEVYIDLMQSYLDLQKASVAIKEAINTEAKV